MRETSLRDSSASKTITPVETRVVTLDELTPEVFRAEVEEACAIDRSAAASEGSLSPSD
jgi:hypothetical protein